MKSIKEFELGKELHLKKLELAYEINEAKASEFRAILSENSFKQSNKKFKVGIMGGTFDPIHNAHLASAEFIKDKYNFDKIIFMPAGDPPHKHNISAKKIHRYDMCLLATRRNEDFIVSDYEIRNEDINYTFETLKFLKKNYPNAELFFITGSDAVCEIETWKNIEEAFDIATFIAGIRPEIDLLETQEVVDNILDKYNTKIIMVYVPSLDISSTYIRRRLKSKKSIKYLVQNSVEEYIRFNNLYKGE